MANERRKWPLSLYSKRSKRSHGSRRTKNCSISPKLAAFGLSNCSFAHHGNRFDQLLEVTDTPTVHFRPKKIQLAKPRSIEANPPTQSPFVLLTSSSYGTKRRFGHSNSRAMRFCTANVPSLATNRPGRMRFTPHARISFKFPHPATPRPQLPCSSNLETPRRSKRRVPACMIRCGV